MTLLYYVGIDMRALPTDRACKSSVRGRRARGQRASSHRAEASRFPESLFPIPKYLARWYQEISTRVILGQCRVKPETRSFLASSEVPLSSATRYK